MHARGTRGDENGQRLAARGDGNCPFHRPSAKRGAGDRRRGQGRARGFTLVELLLVVAMIGVLAALAIVGFKKYVQASHGADARAVIMAIRTAEESYRAETLTYLTTCNNLSAPWYPGTPNGHKRHWIQPGAAYFQQWRQLNVNVDSPTQYGFCVVAGAPGDAVPASNTSAQPNWPNPTTEPWYVVQAAGDTNDNGIYSWFLASSFTGEIYAENEQE